MGYIKSVTWGGYSIGISFLRQILLVPAFVLTVGKESYAFWLLLSSIVFMIRALSLGQLHFSSNVINLNYHVNKGNDELKVAQGANTIYMILQAALGLIIAFPSCLAALSSHSEAFIYNSNAQFSFILLLLSKIIMQYSSLFLLRLFEPVGKINITIKYQTLGELMEFIVTVAVIFVTKSIFYTTLSLFICSIIFSMQMFFFVRRNITYALPKLFDIDYTKSFTLIRQSFLLTISFMVEKVYETGLNLIIVRAYTASILPLFTTSRILSSSFYRVSNTAVLPLIPHMQKNFSLRNEQDIIHQMAMFWKISTLSLIVCITVAMPFISAFYTGWTVNEIAFNSTLVCLLFMAITFQNFGVILNEFLKKTNFSKQILLYNCIKSGLTVACIFAFGYVNNISGMGISLLAGEICGLLYMLFVMISYLQSTAKFEILYHIMPVLLFAGSLLTFIFSSNYLLFVILNSIIVLLYAFSLKVFKRSN